MKRFWISLVSGIVMGLIISLFVYSGESIFFQYPIIHPDITQYVTEQNLDVTIGSIRIMILSFLTIFISWLLIERIINKMRNNNNSV